MTWTLSAFADEAGASTDEQITALCEAGLKHIDLRNVDGFNITELPVDHAREVRHRLDDAGVSVHMFGTPLGKIDIADDFAIDVKKLDHIAALREVFDCPQVRIFSYYNKSGLPTVDWKAGSLDRLAKLREQAAGHGLVLFHENERHIYGDRCPEVLDVASLRDGKTFKLIFDFDNYNQSGDDVWRNWEQLRDQTDAFHLKDSDANNQHVPIGEGAGQAKKILADALARGFAGPLILEPHLAHSAAVMATGPSGQANQQFADMTPAEVFQVAAAAAKNLLRSLNADFA